MILNKVIQFAPKNQYNIQKCCLHLNGFLQKPGAYEGEGKTTVNILNNEADLGLMIDGYSQVFPARNWCKFPFNSDNLQVGFRLNNGITVLGSMVVFPRSVLSWTVNNVSDISEESLSLFTALEPRLDIIVLGTGDHTKDFSFYKKILPFSKKYKLNFEILPTDTACATFNFLCSEGRHVAGAMIPPEIIESSIDDELRTKIRYQNLYERE